MYGERSSTKDSYEAICSVDGYSAAVFVDIGDGPNSPNVGMLLTQLEAAFNQMFHNAVPGNGFDVGWYSSLAHSMLGYRITVLMFPVGKAPQQQADTAE
jgi:hypothetical protein